jgi:hypothetical protein
VNPNAIAPSKPPNSPIPKIGPNAAGLACQLAAMFGAARAID